MADTISNFPDSILCHILSFLPTKSAARTSILSKRWKPLWLLVLTLDFDNSNYWNYHSFRDSVRKAMSLRNITLPTISLRLKCRSSYVDRYDVDRFVCYAMQRGLENLDLDISKISIKLPRLLSSKTLKVLKLEGIKGFGLSHHQVSFPVLKILHLKKVFIEPKYLVKILSGCPVLEDLQTKYLSIGSKDLHVPKKELEGLLRNLIKAKISGDYIIPMTFVRNVESLHMQLAGSIKSTTNLPMFHNLTHIKFKFVDIYLADIYDWILQMLDRSHKLRSLTFQICKYRVNFYEKRWKDPPNVPDCLSSQLRTCCFTGYEDEELNLQFAKYILQNSKVLKTMTIKCSNLVYIDANEMLKKLSSFTRGSETCKLLVD